MATYKVIQDIEAEDHILGPLTLRQFIFALIAVFFFYLSFIFYAKGVIFLDVISLPPALFFGFFAVPFGRDQPTEVWALAKIRYFLKPRKRIWDQSGIKELVTITVPKRIEHQLTDGLTQYEVQSRLKALASTLDTRGWSVKNSLIPQIITPSANGDSDRLIAVNPFVGGNDVGADETDVMDEENSQVAQQFAHMIDESARVRHQQLVSQMSATTTLPAQPSLDNNQWFMPSEPISSNDSSGFAPQPVYAPDVEAGQETSEESAIVSKIKETQQAQKLESNNLRTLQPISKQPRQPMVTHVPSQPPTPMTQPADPAILSLANSDDLSIQAIAHEAKRTKGDATDKDEVVISLH